ncbi:MAG: HAMP domain-containing protein [Alphaproteobacteria bacterium]|nr:HAMP domain-containing protein [Alphaproteobacteria bacterium]
MTVSKQNLADKPLDTNKRSSLVVAILQMVTETRLAYASIFLALVLGLMTYAVLSSPTFLDGQSHVSYLVLGLDVLVLLVLSGFVIRQIIALMKERRSRMAGYQLHLRIAILFSIISVLPSLIVMGFAVFVLDYSLRGWFNDRISTAVEESVTIANSYLEEHKRSVSGQILAMANDINREAPILLRNRQNFDLYLTNQAGVRNLTEALVVDSTGRVLANSKFAYAVTFTDLDEAFFEKANQGEVAIANTDNENRIRAGLRLNQFVDAYLLVGRFVDPTVLASVERTQFASSSYQLLDIRQLDLQVSFGVMFGMVALLLLLGSVWLGLNFANAIVTPISAIISVADRVRSGDHATRVGQVHDKGEIGELAASFDRMLDEINRSRQELVEANVQLDKRREFTEAVLAGVSSGVIGVDHNQIITLPNLAALHMLKLNAQSVIGKKLADVIPEFADLLERAASVKRMPEINIEIIRSDINLTLLTRITREMVGGRVVGYVVTFEDISALMDAQQKATWADVARRIAHEIRNPLTPMQLASERLAQKFSMPDADQDAKFRSNVEMITRQVDDIRRLVDEFSAFARMPAPKIADYDLIDIIASQIMLIKAEATDIAFHTDFGNNASIMIACDDGMIRQVITNLLQNAVDAMTEAESDDKKVLIHLSVTPEIIKVVVIDNGPGLPLSRRKNLTDPYVTNRKDGSGLGLAIVKKIMEDHGGSLDLSSATDDDIELDIAAGYHGAVITLTFINRSEEATG